MKRDSAFRAVAILGFILACAGTVWANGEEFFAAAGSGKIDLVYFGRIKDRLTGRSGAPFALRFHLHPAVEASLIEDGGSARLRLASGAVWRLRASGAELSLGESIYLGTGELRKTQQIVLSGITGPSGATVRWALRREGKPPDQARPDQARPNQAGRDET